MPVRLSPEMNPFYRKAETMIEIRRILFSYKTMVLFLLLFLLHGTFFFYQLSDVKRGTLSGVELENYIETYPQYVSSVLENADNMLDNPLFSNHDSFVYRNVIKTRADYALLRDVVPVYGENRGIMTVLDFKLTSWLMLLAGVWLITQFLSEREKGLYLLVRSTYRGRFPLTLERIITLFLGTTLFSLCLFVSILLISFLVFPGADLLRPVQSIPEFSGISMRCSILTYLCLFLFRRLLGTILTCLMLYLSMSLFRSSLCLLFSGGIFLAEYFLYATLIPTSAFCALKYMNLYTLVFCGTDYGHYYNLNLLGHPVATGIATTVLFLILLPLSAAACLWRFTLQYPSPRQHALPLAEKLQKFWSRKKPSLTPFLWECRKILIDQKGLLIFAVTLFLAWSSAGELEYYDYRTPYVTHWYTDFQGKADSSMVLSIQKKKTSLEKKLNRFQESLARQEEILLEYQQKGYEVWAVESNIANLRQAIQEYTREVNGIQIVLEQAESTLAVSENLGQPLDLIEPSCYELLFQKDYKTVQQNHLYILLTIILMFSGTQACEKSSHMDTVLHTLYHGRRPLLIRKLLLVAGVSILCGLAFHMVQFLAIGKALPYHHLDVLIQSVPCMQSFPLAISIRVYLILLYCFRLLLSFFMGICVMGISHFSRNRMTTIALSVFLMLIPMVLLSFLAI